MCRTTPEKSRADSTIVTVFRSVDLCLSNVASLLMPVVESAKNDDTCRMRGFPLNLPHTDERPERFERAK